MKRKMVWAIESKHGKHLILGRDKIGGKDLAEGAKLVRIAQFK